MYGTYVACLPYRLHIVSYNNMYKYASKHAFALWGQGCCVYMCRADKYSCTQLDSLARDYLRRNFETVVKCDGRPPNRVGLVSLNHTALAQILTDDNLELTSEVPTPSVHS